MTIERIEKELRDGIDAITPWALADNIRALLSEMERLREALERVETIAKDRSEKAWYRLDMIADEAHYAAASRALSTPSNKEGGDHG